MKRKYTGIYFVLPGFAGMLLFYLIPFLDVMRRSVYAALGDGFVGLANYRAVLTNEAFRLAAKNTGRFLLTCIPILLVLSLLVALGIRELCRLTWLKNLYLIPFVIPSATTVLLWQLLLERKGVLNGMMAGITEPVDWMNGRAAFGVLVCCYIWKNLGYHVVLWLAGLHAVPKEILEAASMDGAGRREILLHILLPYLRPVTFMIMVIAIVNSFKVFREAWMLAGSYPHENIYLLQHLFHNWFLELSMDKLAAGAMLLALAAAGIMATLWKFWNKEEHS